MSVPHKPLLVRLWVLSLVMFGFTFALIPLYSVFCSVTGLNGKWDPKNIDTFRRYTSKTPGTQRTVVVEFDTNRNQKLACEFSPQHSALPVVLGELTHTAYTVKNLTQKKMIIQAIVSISPGNAAQYLKKLECFCFTQQTLEPGQSMELPLRFWLEPELPSDIHRLTLSYTLFDVTAQRKERKT